MTYTDNITCDNKYFVVESVNSYKYLEIIIDNKLN